MGDSFIVAIDFGTAYSGYAYSITARQADMDPHVPTWGRNHGFRSPKTPTCILFSEDEKFEKFGYDAKMSYMNMSSEAKGKYLFENFKMSLYGKTLDRDLQIKAKNGKSMRAMKVITESLRFLKDHALEEISKHTSKRKYIASDFTWVLTVPAIWDASSKHFMREAAIMAGIATEDCREKLVMALEPEAASIWCKRLPWDGFITENHEKDKLEQSPGTQYIVVDCGGGTIDITVHEVLQEGALKELYKASGNDLGGETVDKNFKDFLRDTFTEELWANYESSYPSELQKIMYSFSAQKCGDDDVEISCPFNLGALAQKKQNIGEFFKNVQGASWEEGRINVSREMLRSWFNESLSGITSNLKAILKKGFNIQCILLVGGFASSKILYDHVKRQFSSTCKVLCPFNAQEAILKGAVMFGRQPDVVASRKSAFTYGIEVYERFDATKHPAERKYLNKEGEWCREVFKKLVEIDESVGWDENREHTFSPVVADQVEVGFGFYRTVRKDPAYVDEWGLEFLDTLQVGMPDVTLGMNRRVKLEIKLGCTEINATATDMESHSTKSIKLDFMRK